MATKKEFSEFDEKTTSDFFKDMLAQQEDKILEVGNLSDYIGNETQISLSVTRDGCEVYANIDLQPEGELALDADQLDEIGDFVANRISSLLSMLIQNSFKDPDEISVLGNVTINGERPEV